MLLIETLEVTPFAQNARLVFDTESRELCIVDPGGDVSLLIEYSRRFSPSSIKVFLTHAHIDHGGGVEEYLRLAETNFSQRPSLYAHSDGGLRKSIARQALLFGLSPNEYRDVPEPDQVLNEGSVFTVGGVSGKVHWTPGHAPDHISLYFEKQKSEIDGDEVFAPILIAGDTLFAGSVGRTDLPGGSHPQLISSIKEKLLILPDDTVVLSGHGPATTVGREKRYNPFLRG